ncbi:hypothetical protein [Thiomicrorhabdus xiamenensis]|uniref:Phage DNA packaging protein, Nu1 subunit of terminase n=1 Tax=Thiomicrorhabdus xiamenensis TaxID=2739063 RepID=A0A7D4NKN1_9GAMM|nr:hypothetical protein [Thiomicrorhabdus xiamenensis]QKI88534.1 hypothetical protein HQN79_02565 [Thiomicrorhabdus xiamenensis]
MTIKIDQSLDTELTQQQLAEHLGLSTRQVYNLEQKGVIPKRSPNKGYDLTECVQSYLQNLTAKNENKHSTDSTKAQIEQTRLTRLRAEALEIKNENLLNQLLPKELLKAIVIRQSHHVIQTASTLPDHIETLDLNLDKQVIEVIKQTVNQVTQICHETAEGIDKAINESGDLVK